MRKLPLLFLFVFLVGCEYSIPLIKTPETEIDNAVLGLWERKDDGDKTENILILPLDEKEYLVSYYDRDGGMIARAGLVKVGEKMLVQIKWLGTDKGGLPDTDQVYQYATYAVNQNVLSVRLLNSEVISTDLKTTDELTKAVLGNIKNPNLVKDAMVFSRVE